MKKKQKDQVNDGNVESEAQNVRAWTKKEMEDAEPLPIPEIADDEVVANKKSEE